MYYVWYVYVVVGFNVGSTLAWSCSIGDCHSRRLQVSVVTDTAEAPIGVAAVSIGSTQSAVSCTLIYICEWPQICQFGSRAYGSTSTNLVSFQYMYNRGFTITIKQLKQYLYAKKPEHKTNLYNAEWGYEKPFLAKGTKTWNILETIDPKPWPYSTGAPLYPGNSPPAWAS